MDLDDYKSVKQNAAESFSLKEIPELTQYMRGQTQSIVDAIKRNLRFEIIFALLFFIFDCNMLVFFKDIFYLRLFAFLLLIFCTGFIFYLVKLLRYIHLQYTLDISVNEQLVKYIYIVSRFTKLYFQLTMFMIPLIFLLAITAGYLDQDQSGSFVILIYPKTIVIYIGLAMMWSLLMYFITRWYIKKLYGNHLNQLKEQLKELQEV